MTPVTLETRLCISASGCCVVCNQWRGRTIGTTETYFAVPCYDPDNPGVPGTGGWVCYRCASEMDPELAEFAYFPERYQLFRPALVAAWRLGLTPFQHDHWGVCPDCGCPADRCLNVGAAHYLVCLRHGFRWSIGSNLFSWKDAPQSLHEANAEFLSRCCDVEPCTFPDDVEPDADFPKPGWFRDVEQCTFLEVKPNTTFPTGGWIEDTVYCLKAWRPVAVEAGNTTLVEMTDHVCRSVRDIKTWGPRNTLAEMRAHECSVRDGLVRDGFELNALKQLYIDTFSLEARWPFLRPSGEVRKARSGAA